MISDRLERIDFHNLYSRSTKNPMILFWYHDQLSKVDKNDHGEKQTCRTLSCQWPSIYDEEWNSSDSWWRCPSDPADILQFSPTCVHIVDTPATSISVNKQRKGKHAISWLFHLLAGARNDITMTYQVHDEVLRKDSNAFDRVSSTGMIEISICFTLKIMASSFLEKGSFINFGHNWLHHLRYRSRKPCVHQVNVLLS